MVSVLQTKNVLFGKNSFLKATRLKSYPLNYFNQLLQQQLLNLKLPCANPVKKFHSILSLINTNTKKNRYVVNI